MRLREVVTSVFVEFEDTGPVALSTVVRCAPHRHYSAQPPPTYQHRSAVVRGRWMTVQRYVVYDRPT